MTDQKKAAVAEKAAAPDVEIVDDAPAADNLPAINEDRPPANRKEGYEQFAAALNARADEIAAQLPSNVPRERFINASLSAVRANPSVLVATPRSLMGALVKAAQDGLVPDGREGVITVYSTKVNGAYQNLAQWNPMLFGIRKRARELDGIIIDAQVVYTGDEFDYLLGDEPRIFHKPRQRLGADFVPDSEGIAAYAIFKHPTQGIVHREVMWANEIATTRNQSRQKDGLLWTKFWTEGWRKTVIRRGSKSVPVSADFTRLVQREDENFDFGEDRTARLAAAANIGARLNAGTPMRVSYAEKAATPPQEPAAAPAKGDKPAPAVAAPEGKAAALWVPENLSSEERVIAEDLLGAMQETSPLSAQGLALIQEEFQPAFDLASAELKTFMTEAFDFAREHVVK